MFMLLHNSIQCPDGTILVSKHKYDFKSHTQEDGREYFVDGGLDYQRIGYSDKEYVDLSVRSDDPHEKIREHFEWVRRMNEQGQMLPKSEVVKLKDITDSHLMALVEYTKEGYPEEINKVFVDEIEFRKTN
jgi:hypothetical protein